jgi:hypothetical protein
MFRTPPTYEKVIFDVPFVCTFIWTCTLLVPDWLGFICFSRAYLSQVIVRLSISVAAPKVGTL